MTKRRMGREMPWPRHSAWRDTVRDEFFKLVRSVHGVLMPWQRV